MKYNPVTHQITRADGTPYLHLDPGIGAKVAYIVADTLLQAPEWEKEKEELEAQVAGLEQDLKTIEEQCEELREERNSAEAHAEKLEDELDSHLKLVNELESTNNDLTTELTQARLRIEELEAMLAACELALFAAQPQPQSQP